MRLSLAAQSLILAISSLFPPNHALPLNERPGGLPDFVHRAHRARATYSVVPINGGGPGSGSGPPVTVTQTVVRTATPAAAKTTVSVPNTVFVTRTVSVPVVPIQPQPTTVVVTYIPTTTSSILSTSSSELYTSEYLPASSAATSYDVAPSTGSEFSVGFISTTASSTSSVPTAYVTSLSSTSTYLPTVSSSSKTYDDGMWHTTYPPWNGTALVRRHP